jgi:hypothetical protein
MAFALPRCDWTPNVWIVGRDDRDSQAPSLIVFANEQIGSRAVLAVAPYDLVSCNDCIEMVNIYVVSPHVSGDFQGDLEIDDLNSRHLLPPTQGLHP